jgi:hypothetical protein
MKALLLSLAIAAIASCSTNSSQVSPQELPASDPFSADSLSAEAEEAWIATEEDPDALMEAIQLEIEKTSSGFDETGATFQGCSSASGNCRTARHPPGMRSSSTRPIPLSIHQPDWLLIPF